MSEATKFKEEKANDLDFDFITLENLPKDLEALEDVRVNFDSSADQFFTVLLSYNIPYQGKTFSEMLHYIVTAKHNLSYKGNHAKCILYYRELEICLYNLLFLVRWINNAENKSEDERFSTK